MKPLQICMSGSNSYKTSSIHGSGQNFPYGLVVRIPAFHAGGPGSIPGVGAYFTQTDVSHQIQGHICPSRDKCVPPRLICDL